MTRYNAKRIQKRIKEATAILKALGLPQEQMNDRSALTLLALLRLTPESAWSEAEAHLIGVTPIMDFILHTFNRPYAPNSRETFRRFTLHQFVQAGLVELNPDKPDRPTNSPNNVYRIEETALSLLKGYGAIGWKESVAAYLESMPSLRNRYASERDMRRIPLVLPDGQSITLSPGGQNVLVKQIIEDFCPLFTPAAIPIYAGDTGEKWAFFDKSALAGVGVAIEGHGKIPDVLVYMKDKNWLVLIEAVTSHGPISPKRLHELKELFASATAGLVYVTAFPDRKTFLRYASDIAWETEVWIAASPTHMIHFNGDRFLGPRTDNSFLI